MKIFVITVATAVFSVFGHCSSKLTHTTDLVTRAKEPDSCTPKSPAPSKTVCGRAGQLNFPLPQRGDASPQTLSLASCRDFCFHLQICTFFSWDTKSSLCTFHTVSDPADNSFQANSSSTADFYELKCFDCSQTCPTPQGYNLIDNSGFELSAKYYGPWATYRTKGTQIVSPGLDSKHALTFRSVLNIYRRLCPSQLYLLSFDVKVVEKANSLNSSASFLAYQAFMGDATVLQDFTLNDKSLGKWQTKYVTIKSTESQEAFSIEPYSPKSKGKPVFQTFLDNVVVTPVPPVLNTTGPTLVSNGGFETGDYKPFQVGSEGKQKKIKVVSPGLASQGGTRSKHALHYTGYDDYDHHYEDSYGYFAISQTISETIEAEELYLLQFRYLAYNTTEIGVAIGTNNKWFLSNADDLNNKDSNVKQFSRVFTGSGKADILSITFTSDIEYGSINNFLEVYIDDINIYKVANSSGLV